MFDPNRWAEEADKQTTQKEEVQARKDARFALRVSNKTGKGLPILPLLSHRHDACGRKSAV